MIWHSATFRKKQNSVLNGRLADAAVELVAGASSTAAVPECMTNEVLFFKMVGLK